MGCAVSAGSTGTPDGEQRPMGEPLPCRTSILLGSTSAVGTAGGNKEAEDDGRLTGHNPYEHIRPVVQQATHFGLVSSHCVGSHALAIGEIQNRGDTPSTLTWRRLHSKQPNRDFLFFERAISCLGQPFEVWSGVN